MERFSLILGDITHAQVDAIVNAVAPSRLGDSGVDSAIYAAAGVGLLVDCRSLSDCETGEVKLTNGYQLPAKYIIHTVAPVWQGGEGGEAALLAACYRNALELAATEGFETVDFPSLATGSCGYPPTLAAPVALRAIMTHLRSTDLPRQVRLVCFNQETFQAYRQSYNMWYAVDKAHRL